ncbi:MAG: CPBP family intramembrane glutamic endopeptidase [Chloroflexota bacterium]
MSAETTRPRVVSPGEMLVGWFYSPRAVRTAALYLGALATAELLTALVTPQFGLVLHGALLVLLIANSAVAWQRPGHGLLLALTFAPMIRILSLSMPLTTFPLIYWYFITSAPLFVACAVAARLLGLGPGALGLRPGFLPLQLVIGLTGFVFGFTEYVILQPVPLAKEYSWEQVWLPALILLVSTGFFEELVFRGLMQRVAVELMGRRGVLYVAALFAVLHAGYKSVVDVAFVFVVGLFFGAVAARTRSLFGVTLAHGLTNVMLFLVMPFTPVPNLQPLQPTLSGAPQVPVLPRELSEMRLPSELPALAMPKGTPPLELPEWLPWLSLPFELPPLSLPPVTLTPTWTPAPAAMAGPSATPAPRGAIRSPPSA